MNFLAHLHLSGPNPDVRVGGVLADFVRGRREQLESCYSPGVVDGIELHRLVDRHMDTHPVIRQARAILHPTYSHRSRVILDVLFDFYLATHWQDLAAEPLDKFVLSCYRDLQDCPPDAPEPYHRFVDNLVSYDVLRAYCQWDGIEETFERLNHRLRRPMPVGSLMADLQRNENKLLGSFLTFYPDVQRVADQARNGVRDAV